ncbi:E3 ubiquitin protein ligase DRIP2-like isoform X2 [Diospyros lotus]|uniref:E3 ubiquitin protein ligase DRIP2-like isoform X2 n=1 Tax=Diospyros lotus TaxID=55363 RepID=UPI00225BC206|nr:E3 ubiquitin protein ligase DRIP2-like isoform X2 [Diospyros lotus]
MSNQVMKVRRETILEWMTCPLCNKLLRDATTISECLHTFCRKCIHKKLSDEELECCPVCNISLGCVPLEKLRPDHNMQDLRAKICPFKRRKVRAPEVAPSLTLPIKRKERSLSSLVVSTPRLPAQTAMTGRRSRAFARKASSLRGSSFSAEKAVKKEEVSVEDLPESSSSPETLNKFSQNLKQSSSNAEMLRQPMPEKEARCDTENWDGKIDLWKPLNHLVEVASRTKSSKYIPQGAVGKPESLDSPDGEVHFSKLKVRQHGTKLRVQNKKDSLRLVPPDSVTPKKLQRIRPKKAAPSREFSVSPQDVLDAVGARGERRINPIWFSLVASEDQECHAPLPQIPANYLRIKWKSDVWVNQLSPHCNCTV